LTYLLKHGYKNISACLGEIEATLQYYIFFYQNCSILVVNCRRMPLTGHLVAGGETRNVYSSVSQPPGRGPVPRPGINYTGPREVLLEVVILVF
jgi:hypothetical protein